MIESLRKKLSSLLGKADEKVIAAKVKSFLEENEPVDLDALSKKVKSVDKKEILDTLSEFDSSKLSEMNIDAARLKEKIQEIDMGKVTEALGENGKEIVNKVLDILDEGKKEQGVDSDE